MPPEPVVQMWVVPPPRLLVKAIRAPSGDHDGSRSAPASFVICRGLCSRPPEPTDQMSSLPLRLLVKAIRDPSGDQVGDASAVPSFVIRRIPASGPPLALTT